MYPVFSTINTQPTPDSPCVCPNDKKNPECNVGRGGVFQLALLFPKTGDDGSAFIAGWTNQALVKAGQTSARKFHSRVTGLAEMSRYFTAHRDSYPSWIQGKPVLKRDTILNIPPFRQFSQDFSTLGRGMSLMSFDLRYDGTEAPINMQGIPIRMFSNLNITTADGDVEPVVMCSDTIFRSNILDKMSSAPPVSVVQPYLQCHPTLTSAFSTALGVAAANSALISSIVSALALYLALKYLNRKSKSKSGERYEKIISPAKKFENLIAKVELLSAELATLKDQQPPQPQQPQMQQSSQSSQSPPPPQHQPTNIIQQPTSGSQTEEVFTGENPLHRRDSVRGWGGAMEEAIFLRAARASQAPSSRCRPWPPNLRSPTPPPPSL